MEALDMGLGLLCGPQPLAQGLARGSGLLHGLLELPRAELQRLARGLLDISGLTAQAHLLLEDAADGLVGVGQLLPQAGLRVGTHESGRTRDSLQQLHTGFQRRQLPPALGCGGLCVRSGPGVRRGSTRRRQLGGCCARRWALTLQGLQTLAVVLKGPHDARLHVFLLAPQDLDFPLELLDALRKETDLSGTLHFVEGKLFLLHGLTDIVRTAHPRPGRAQFHPCMLGGVSAR
mmetsp:Transcript_6746/g.18590  ORF Transcript_6746/g.18590 Transcript_6746/m.18590 type:complete len:233 (+) Transcript_6746:1329-2027(+)